RVCRELRDGRLCQKAAGTLTRREQRFHLGTQPGVVVARPVEIRPAVPRRREVERLQEDLVGGGVPGGHGVPSVGPARLLLNARNNTELHASRRTKRPGYCSASRWDSQARGRAHTRSAARRLIPRAAAACWWVSPA